jgi:lipopolysaccharide transport system ATP-binding protein
MKPILEIRNIGKKYKIQHLAGGYLSLRERIVSALKFEKNSTEDFWALKDISFDVQPGESIGIIGRNGAGKSTLLKILSKITQPTTGHIISRGRIASLLEVGTGFHPELTGRENIFFNGSLLGMKRKEIERKFDEIVDFSGVEKFLDTPLKHFSSGMQLRLAFAVAAFLEPEILIIDEVLAVGDAEFQKKCLGKMEDVSKSGRTILFVSHNLASVDLLCSQVISLKSGQIVGFGNTQEQIKKYLLDQNHTKTDFNNRKGNQALKVIKIDVFSQMGEKKNSLRSDEPFKIKMKYEIVDPNFQFNQLIVGIGLMDSMENPILLHHNRLVGSLFNDHRVKENSTFCLEVESLNLNAGSYKLHYSIMQGLEYIDHADNVSELVIEDAFPYNYRELPSRSASKIVVNAKWSIE